MSPEVNRSEEVIADLLKSTSAETGLAFLRALVRFAAQAMKVSGVWVTEYKPEPKVLRAVAFWLNGRYVQDYEYTILGTPCEQVIDNRCLIHYPDRIIELFPDDPDLVKLNAVSYAGIPLVAADGAFLGHLSALDTKPMDLTEHLQSVFWFFASRASAELMRLRSESDLRQNERRLSQLFDSTMDGIIELDHRFQILQANQAAARLFGISAESLSHRNATSVLTRPSAEKLYAIGEGLGQCDQYSTWIPRGLQAVRSDGSCFPAEASLSRFEMEGQCRYSLILRNTREQLAAEERPLGAEEERPYKESNAAALRPVAGIVGESPVVRELTASIQQVAVTPATVLIVGETGTGKELVAHAIHKASQRAAKPFVRVNCAAIPSGLWESEFFGHEKGAFTSAAARRAGRFELAHGGTIFLDEVGEIPLELQPKLLRVLQEHEYETVGGSQTRKVDVRVIVATNRDLSAEVAAGRFREDLYYRLNVFPITVPPLRDRGDDVEVLARKFIDRFSARVGMHSPRLSADCLRRLRSYHWPGNVRELENMMERAVILARDGVLSLRSVLPASSFIAPRETRLSGSGNEVRTKRDLREMERGTLIQALEHSRWKVAGPQGAAQMLGVPPSTLASRMKALGIRRPPQTTSPRDSRNVSRELESDENSLRSDEPTAHVTI
jgi:PAS domain S-box-containing protein